MPLKINGASTGSVTLNAPNTGTDVTITLPGSSATLATSTTAYMLDGPTPSNRNMLYNGAMTVNQRNSSVSNITTTSYNTADRWYIAISSLGTWTQDIQNDAPTGSGFRRSLRMLCTTADSAPAASDFLIVSQILEGQDVQRIRKGTSSAQRITLSFWVKTNVAGTYVVELRDNDNSRAVSATYSIAPGDSGNWVRRTITFPADTIGVFDNDNGASLECNFWLAGGSNFTSGSPLQTAWGTATNTRATGQTNLASAINNSWQVTGVQLEIGDIATDFEFKPFGQELRECQRYYEKSYNQNVFPGAITDVGNFVRQGPQNSGAITGEYPLAFAVEKRAAPTVTFYSPNNGAAGFIFNRFAADGSTANRNNGLYTTAGTRSVVFGVGTGVGIGFYLPNDNTFIRWQWTAEIEL